jgi:hypothetical protein
LKGTGTTVNVTNPPGGEFITTPVEASIPVEPPNMSLPGPEDQLGLFAILALKLRT